MPIYFGSGAPYNAMNLIESETQGLAIEAMLEGGGVSVKDTTTPANSLRNVLLDSSSLVQAGTSPKLVNWNPITPIWSPHNLVLQSQALDSASWSETTSSVTVTANAVTAPDGTLTADQIVHTGNASVGTTAALTILKGAIYTMSFYAKPGTTNWVRGTLGDDWPNATNAVIAWFNVGTGTLGTNNIQGSGWSIVSATVTPVVSGWYRCTLSVTTGAATAYAYVRAANADNTTASSGNTMNIWGVQVNRGPAATAYVPTTTLAVTGTLQNDPFAWNPHNIFIQSQTLDNAAWTPGNVTVVADATKAPNGTLTAESITGSSSSSNIKKLGGTAASVVSAGTYTISAYFKYGSHQYVALAADFPGSAGVGGIFDIQNGIDAGSAHWFASGGASTANIASTTITNVGGWYRCTITFQNLAQTSCDMRIYMFDNNTSVWDANSTSVGTFYMWGAQINRGSIATTYVPTTTVALGAPIQVGDPYVIWTPHNFVTQSQTQSGWGTTGISWTNNSTTAPDGTATGNLLTGDGSSGAHNSYLNINTLEPFGQIYTHSVYFKAGTNPYAFLAIGNGGDYINVVYDLSTGTIGEHFASKGTLINQTITPVGNGWYLCTITGALFSTAAFTNLGICPLKTGNTWDGNGNAPSTLATTIFVWGAQANLGNQPTPYVPTAATAMTNYVQANPYMRWTTHNQLLQSTAFDNASWIKNSSSITPNITTAPDGSLSADKLVEAAAGGISHSIDQTWTGTSATIWTASVYAKAAERSWVMLGLWNGGGYSAQASFNVSAGTIGTINAGNVDIQSVGSGWYRLSVTGLMAASAGQEVDIWAMTADNTTVYTGNGTSGVYIWGAQVNRGPIALPYLVTTSAARIGIPQEYITSKQTFGILVEPAATNLLQRTQEIDNVFWTAQNGTITANETFAPDGTLTADRYLVTSAATNVYNFYAINITTTASTVYTASVYVKSKTAQYFTLVETAATATDQWVGVTCDLINGNITQVINGAGTVTSAGSTMTYVGNGWYRISVSASHLEAVTNFSMGLTNTPTPALGSKGDFSFTSVGTEAVWTWGAQLELGNVATSYIPTVAATVTRATDAINIPTSAYPHNATGGTFVAWVVPRLTNNPQNVRWLELNDGTNGNTIGAQYYSPDTPDSPALGIQNGGVTQVDPNVTKNALASLIGDRGAFFYKLNDSGVVIDGGSEVVDTVCTIPTVNNLQLGYSAASASRELNGYITRLVYLPRRMLTAEMQAATVR